ncbi:MAG: STAS domain-containing protein [Candidatus Brocadiia bacterium]
MLRCKFLGKGEGIELIGVLDETTCGQIEKLLVSYKTGQLRLDMAGLQELRDGGMRPLILASKRLKKAGGDLVLANIPPHIREFLHTEGYDLLLTLA